MERHWLPSHQLLTFYQPAPNPRICELFIFHSRLLMAPIPDRTGGLSKRAI
jgi:hypothetical protein